MGLPAKKISEFSLFEQIQLASDVVGQEANALEQLAKNIPVDLPKAAEVMANCGGSVIVTGIGKAGWIGQKISATLSSTGTRSHFLNPSEAVHGDLGKVGTDDVVLAFSNSGETSELIQILPTIQRLGVPVIAITANSQSTLADFSEYVLDYGKTPEACPLGLAPTTTTTIMLALGDALSMVTSRLRDLQPNDFARCHPGGSLGKQLSTVEEIMRPISECRVASENISVRNMYVQLRGPKRRSGAILLVDESQKLSGIFTDSDLARLLEREQDDLLNRPIREVMTKNPSTVQVGSKTIAAVDLLGSLSISELPVVDSNNRPQGLIDITDVVGLLPLDTKQSA